MDAPIKAALITALAIVLAAIISVTFTGSTVSYFGNSSGATKYHLGDNGTVIQQRDHGTVHIQTQKYSDIDLITKLHNMRALEYGKGERAVRFIVEELAKRRIPMRDFDLTKANLRGANLNGGDFRAVRMDGVNMRGVNAIGVDMRGAEIRKANIFDEADFSNANLQNVEFTDSDLSEVDFKKANLAGVDFSGAILYDADFSYANLSNAKLAGTDLTEANFHKAKLTNTDISRTDLRDTNNLTFPELSKACFDQNSPPTLPKEWKPLAPKNCP